MTELFLVCDQASKVQTLFVIGILAEIFSILFNGWLADTIGRKSSIFWNNVIFFTAIGKELKKILFYDFSDQPDIRKFPRLRDLPLFHQCICLLDDDDS